MDVTFGSLGSLGLVFCFAGITNSRWALIAVDQD
jgi:hypothetical protein